MGKVRVKTLGVEEVEKQQKKEALKRKEQKKTAKVPGLKGGQRVVAVGPTEEELARLDELSAKQKKLEVQEVPKVSKEKAKDKTRDTRGARSSRYQTVAKLVEKTKYTLSEALELLPKLHLSSFDETVELHINTIDKGITATAILPHGSGKKVRVAIANDQIISDVLRGKINFDVLLAEPSIMPKLARVAKFLGPRGLMPNPKNGTITTNPKELTKKYQGGQVNLKTESKYPIMHIVVGKLSFGQKKLLDNIQIVLNAVKLQNIKNVTLKSTMSPGIKVQLVKLG
ncbi:MAG: hypothetical protein AAB600_04645 [Patescibacteria group bacterium]